MHKLIYDKLQKTLQTYQEDTDGLHFTQSFLDRLHLLALLDHTNDFHCIQDYFYTDAGTEPANRWWMSITIPMDHKTALRHLLFTAIDTIGPFTKSFLVTPTYNTRAPYNLYELWIAKWDRAAHPERDRTYATNKLTVRFVRTAQEGERLTDTCTVTRVEENNAPASYERLAIVCHTDNT